jgi:hypothetical protein
MEAGERSHTMQTPALTFAVAHHANPSPNLRATVGQGDSDDTPPHTCAPR